MLPSTKTAGTSAGPTPVLPVAVSRIVCPGVAVEGPARVTFDALAQRAVNVTATAVIQEAKVFIRFLQVERTARVPRGPVPPGAAGISPGIGVLLPEGPSSRFEAAATGRWAWSSPARAMPGRTKCIGALPSGCRNHPNMPTH